MTLWLRAAREGIAALTKPTQPTEPQAHRTPREVLSVKSVLSAARLAAVRANPALLDAWEERAAIREYDGGETREQAEWGALRDVEGLRRAVPRRAQ